MVVQQALALQHRTVQRHPVTGPHQHHVAGQGVLGRDRAHFAPLHQVDDLGAQIQRLHDIAAALFHSLVLKIFTNAVENHNAQRLGIIADGKGAQRGDAHQEIFVQRPAVDEVDGGLLQHAPAAVDIAHHEQNQGGNVAGQNAGGGQEVLQHLADHQSGGACDNADQVPFSLVAILLRLALGLTPGGPGGDGDLGLDGRADLLDPGQKLQRMSRLHPQLLGGVSQCAGCHLRHLADLGLHFGCTVGAAQIVHQKDLRDRALDVLVLSGRLTAVVMVMMAAAAIVVIIVVMMVMSAPAIIIVVVMVMAAAAIVIIVVVMVVVPAAAIIIVVLVMMVLLMAVFFLRVVMVAAATGAALFLLDFGSPIVIAHGESSFLIRNIG